MSARVRVCCREKPFDGRIEGIQNIGKKLLYPLALLGITSGLLVFFVYHSLPMYIESFSQLKIDMPLFLQLAQRLLDAKPTGSSALLLMLSALCFGLWACIKLLRLACFRWLFSSDQSDLLWLVAMLTKQGLSLKTTFEVINPFGSRSNQSRFSNLKTKFFSTGSFATSWQSVYPLSIYHHELLLSAERSAAFSPSIATLAELMRSEKLDRQMRMIRLLQPTLMILLGILIFAMMYITYLPTLNSLKLIDI